MTIGKYPIIYADPPWRYTQKGLQGAAEHHYPTMSINELCALPVAELAAPDSALFLWATFPQLPEALRLIEAWGFTYKSVAFVWLKKNRKADFTARKRAYSIPSSAVSIASSVFPSFAVSAAANCAFSGWHRALRL